MSESTLTLPEKCAVGLRQLYSVVLQAQKEYNIAVNSAVSALGLDPSLPNEVNLDTGVITPAPAADSTKSPA